MDNKKNREVKIEYARLREINPNANIKLQFYDNGDYKFKVSPKQKR